MELDVRNTLPDDFTLGAFTTAINEAPERVDAVIASEPQRRRFYMILRNMPPPDLTNIPPPRWHGITIKGPKETP